VLTFAPAYVPALYGKGESLYNQGKYNEAMKYYDKALELDPNYAGAWNGKGNILCCHGKYNEAMKCFDKSNIY